MNIGSTFRDHAISQARNSMSGDGFSPRNYTVTTGARRADPPSK
jgi:hypothetical protein